MTKKTIRAKTKKRRPTPDELQIIKEKQKLLYLKQRRKIRKRQMQLHRIKSLLRLGCIIFLLLIAVYIMKIPQWRINPFIFSCYPNNNLVFKDNLITRDSQILNKLKQFEIKDQPIYLLKTNQFKDAIKELDPIEEVYVRRYWLPTRLIFTITEKQPLLLVQNNINEAPAYALTATGSKIGHEYLPLPEKYKEAVFNIIVSPSAEVLNPKNIEKIEKIIRIAEKSTGENLIYMDLRNTNDIYLNMSKSLIRLGGNDATVIERISRLQAIMPSVKPIEKDIDYIDLRWDQALSLKEKIKEEDKKQNNIKPKTENQSVTITASDLLNADHSPSESQTNKESEEKPNQETKPKQNTQTNITQSSISTETILDIQNDKHQNNPKISALRPKVDPVKAMPVKPNVNYLH